MIDLRVVSDVASASNFANANNNGNANNNNASNAGGGVRPIIITCTQGYKLPLRVADKGKQSCSVQLRTDE